METQITKEQVIDYLGALSVQEIAILIDDLQETWGISLPQPVQQVPNVEQKPEDEQTEFDIVLEGYGDKKINVIKTIRQVIPGLGLKEAKEFVESAPVKIKEATEKEDAEEIKTKLEEAGATITIK